MWVAEAGIVGDDAPIMELHVNGLTEFEPYYVAHESARRLLEGLGRPTAIIGSTAEHAWGALDAARDLGIAVPQSLRVIGYGDYIPKAITRAALSTVVQDRAEIVRRSTQSLLKLMTGEYEAVNIRVAVPTRLEVRET